MTNQKTGHPGTNLTQKEFERLFGNDGNFEITYRDAAYKISSRFGFEVLHIFIRDRVKEAEEHHRRQPQYRFADCNYIAFRVCGIDYEMINGDLFFYHE